MRVLVTGATGFAGRWLAAELRDAGHEVIATGGRHDPDITDARAIAATVAAARPDAIAHLAGLSFGPDAAEDPAAAMAVNADGTRNVLDAAAALPTRPVILVVSSADVYGPPDPGRPVLDEASPLRASQPYGRSKIALEQAATAAADRHGLALTITRPFNHTGPGQRLDFVVPALAARIAEAAQAGDRTIRAGNVDVRRDIGDVRDVVRAYRLLLEQAAAGDAPHAGPRIVNVATGRSVEIRAIATELARIAGIEVEIEVDDRLVRADDPPEIRGDATRLAEWTGWRPRISLSETLADVYRDVATRLREGAQPLTS